MTADVDPRVLLALHSEHAIATIEANALVEDALAAHSTARYSTALATYAAAVERSNRAGAAVLAAVRGIKQ